MSNRRDMRERAMQALYAREMAGGEVRHLIDTIITPDVDDAAAMKFGTSLFLRTLDHTEEADELIRKHLKNWDFDRVALVDRLVLRVAIVELLTFEDIPPKVSINEGIEIAKKFSTARSGQFVNGILDAVLLELQETGRLQKSGRGLVDMSPSRSSSTP